MGLYFISVRVSIFEGGGCYPQFPRGGLTCFTFPSVAQAVSLLGYITPPPPYPIATDTKSMIYEKGWCSCRRLYNGGTKRNHLEYDE